jgi:hypothetical protein
MRHLFPIILLFSCQALPADEPEAPVAELRATISKIVDAQTLESKERSDWEARKAEFAALLELHRRELTLLDEELEKAGQSAPGHSESTDDIQAEIQTLKQTRRLASETVARNVPRSLSIAARFPDPLQKECETEISSLNAWVTSDEPREALQSILSLLAKAQQFDRRLTRTTEIRDGREVDVLYLGLARAFYAGRKEGAGIGIPGPNGWTWQPKPQVRSELLAALDMLDKKRTPAMVQLPLEIR